MRVQQVTEALCEHAEGPVWVDSWGGLRWVDIFKGDVLHLDSVSQDVSSWHVGEIAAAIRPRSGGGAVVAGESEFLLFDEVGSSNSSRIAVPVGAATRFNDGTCDPSGAFLCGTMRYDEGLGGGSLYSLRPNGTVETVLRGVTISNGFGFSPSGEMAFYVDTPTGRVDCFDWDPSLGLHNRRPFVTIAPDMGAPDGLCVDSEGGVWLALWGGYAVHRYSPDARLDEVVELPVPQVTACTFGGARLDELYVTTSRYRSASGQGIAGAVFKADAGIAGLAALPFAG